MMIIWRFCLIICITCCLAKDETGIPIRTIVQISAKDECDKQATQLASTTGGVISVQTITIDGTLTYQVAALGMNETYSGIFDCQLAFKAKYSSEVNGVLGFNVSKTWKITTCNAEMLIYMNGQEILNYSCAGNVASQGKTNVPATEYYLHNGDTLAVRYKYHSATQVATAEQVSVNLSMEALLRPPSTRTAPAWAVIATVVVVAVVFLCCLVAGCVKSRMMINQNAVTRLNRGKILTAGAEALLGATLMSNKPHLPPALANPCPISPYDTKHAPGQGVPPLPGPPTSNGQYQPYLPPPRNGGQAAPSHVPQGVPPLHGPPPSYRQYQPYLPFPRNGGQAAPSPCLQARLFGHSTSLTAHTIATSGPTAAIPTATSAPTTAIPAGQPTVPCHNAPLLSAPINSDVFHLVEVKPENIPRNETNDGN